MLHINFRLKPRKFNRPREDTIKFKTQSAVVALAYVKTPKTTTKIPSRDRILAR
nr:hypothetical protein [uncultured Campylobacter sp.]